MTRFNNQTERLDYLIRFFKEESVYDLSNFPSSSLEDKENLLRGLMNIRMPKEIDEEVLSVQDEYLINRNKKVGIVDCSIIEKVDNISIWQGDITRLSCDAIVNAANSQMLGCFVPLHKCIDNSIHTFAGVELRNECFNIMSELKAKYNDDYEQPTGVPILTKAYNLPSKYVIHIVGPIIHGEVSQNQMTQLADCYRNSLDLSRTNNIKSVAFCCISTGVYNFPNELAARIAVDTVKDWLRNNEEYNIHVIFNVFKDKDRLIYERLLS